LGILQDLKFLHHTTVEDKSQETKKKTASDIAVLSVDLLIHRHLYAVCLLHVILEDIAIGRHPTCLFHFFEKIVDPSEGACLW